MMLLVFLVNVFLGFSLITAQKLAAIANSPAVANCFPFGGGGMWGGTDWGSYVFFQYSNLPATTFYPGDVLAFDLGEENDFTPAYASIAVATPAEDASGMYTTIIPDSAASSKGDTVIGNFETRFTITSPYSFPGGNLIIRFQKGGNNADITGFSTDSTCTQVNVYGESSDSSGKFVSRHWGYASTTSGNPTDTHSICQFVIYGGTNSSIYPSISPSIYNPTISPVINVNFDGYGSPLHVVVAPGDTVTYSATYPPFSMTSTEFTISNVYSYSHISEYYYNFFITDSLNQGGSGGVAVRLPFHFDDGNHNYYLNVGQFIRWQWNEYESTPPYPTFFYGSDHNPGFSRSGSNYYDYIFTLPGYYYWYVGSEVYEVIIYDPIEIPHYNIKWGSSLDMTEIHIRHQDHLFFYVSDGNQQNIHIINSRNTLVWSSQELLFPGDYDYVSLPPGRYAAYSDYDPMLFLLIIVDDPHDDHNSNFKSLIPKSILHSVEISLFVFGVFGLTNFLYETLRETTPKIPKIPKIPIGKTGHHGHISFHALEEKKQRE